MGARGARRAVIPVVPALAAVPPPVSTVLAAALVTGMAWLSWSGVRHGIWVDSDVYVMGGRVVREGGDLYAARSEAGLPFTYSPFAAVLFVPLAALDVDVARVLFTVVSLACLAGVVAVLARRLRLSAWQVVLLAGTGLAVEPMVRNLLLGQVNLVLVALVVCDWLVVPHRYRGVLTGLAAGIKITPGAFVVLAVLRRDWGVVARSAAGLAATVVAGWVVDPAASSSFWGGGALGLERFGGAAVLGSDNQSLVGAWLRLTGTTAVPRVVQVAALVVGVGLGAAAAAVELRARRPDAEVAAVGWVALGALLGSPISWSHHWVWVVVPLAVLAARRRHLAVALTTAVVWYPVIWVVATPGGYRELAFSPGERLVSCAYVVVALVLLASVVLPPWTVRLRRRHEHRQRTATRQPAPYAAQRPSVGPSRARAREPAQGPPSGDTAAGTSTEKVAPPPGV